jgi:hypothetical protein
MDDFCILVFFVSDNFIRDVVREVSGQLNGQRYGYARQKAAILINGDVTLRPIFNPGWPISPGRQSHRKHY